MLLLPPPQPAARTTKSKAVATRNLAPSSLRRTMSKLARRMRARRHKIHGITIGLPVPGLIPRGRGEVIERAVVVTISVAVTEFVPSKFSEEGEIEQVAAVGAPAQLSDTG